MAPKPKRPDYQGSLASYKQSVADKPKNLDLPSPTDVVNWASGIVASGRTAAGQTQPVTPGDKGLRTLGQGISLANTYLNPYANTTRKALGAAVNRDRQSLTELSKSAAVDALISGTAYAAGKGIELGINSAIKSGIPTRIGNKLTGQEVLLHGRQTAGYSYIKPAGGKVENNPELRKYAFSWYDNPNVNPTGDIAQTYAGNTGTVYAVKGPKSSFINDANRSVAPNFKKDVVIASQQNQKVVGSVSMTGLNKQQKAEQIQNMLKLAGVKIPKKK